MDVKEFYTGKLFVKTYCVYLEPEHLGIIDPGGFDEELADYVTKEGPKRISILLTHGHFDHVGGIQEIINVMPDTRIYIHAADSGYLGESGAAEQVKCFSKIHAERYIIAYEKQFGALPEPTDILHGGEMLFGYEVIHTPGHTPGSICFYSNEHHILFSGDTLFYHSYGRTDLYGGCDDDMKQSLKKILTLPGDTAVYPGHGSNTTIKEEVKSKAALFD